MTRERWLLAAIVGIALAFRIVGFGWGVPREGRPYGLNTDERTTQRVLARMDPRRLDFNPGYFDNSAFYYYQCGAAYALGAATGWIRLTGDRTYYYEHPEQDARFYYAGRFLSLAWGLATIVVVFLIGRDVGGPVAGLIAAGTLAFAPTHIVNSRMMTNEASQLFWLALALWYAIRAARRPALREYVLLGGALGLALGTKLTAIPFFIWIPIVHLVRVRPQGEGLFARLDWPIIAGLVAGAAFLAVNPYFLGGIEQSLATRIATRGQSPGYGSPSLLRVLTTTAIGFGPFIVAAALAGIGVAVARRDRIDGTLVGALVPMVLILAKYPRFAVDRRMLVLLPIAAVLIARPLTTLLADRRRRIAGIAALAILAGGSAIWAALAIGRFAQPDQTALAAAWMRLNLPDSTSVGFSPTYAYWRGPDEIGHDYLIASDTYHAGLAPRTPYRYVVRRTFSETLAARPDALIDASVPDSPGDLSDIIVGSGAYRLAAMIDQPRPGLAWVSPGAATELLLFHIPIRIWTRADIVIGR